MVESIPGTGGSSNWTELQQRHQSQSQSVSQISADPQGLSGNQIDSLSPNKTIINSQNS